MAAGAVLPWEDRDVLRENLAMAGGLLGVAKT